MKKTSLIPQTDSRTVYLDFRFELDGFPLNWYKGGLLNMKKWTSYEQRRPFKL